MSFSQMSYDDIISSGVGVPDTTTILSPTSVILALANLQSVAHRAAWIRSYTNPVPLSDSEWDIADGLVALAELEVMGMVTEINSLGRWRGVQYYQPLNISGATDRVGRSQSFTGVAGFNEKVLSPSVTNLWVLEFVNIAVNPSVVVGPYRTEIAIRATDASNEDQFVFANANTPKGEWQHVKMNNLLRNKDELLFRWDGIAAGDPLLYQYRYRLINLVVPG
jgi:hypothetical protein